MVGWIGLATESVGMIRDLIKSLADPDIRKALYELKLFKQYRKAVNYAEKAFAVCDGMIILTTEVKDQKTYDKLLDDYSELKNKFNKYD